MKTMILLHRVRPKTIIHFHQTRRQASISSAPSPNYLRISDNTSRPIEHSDRQLKNSSQASDKISTYARPSHAHRRRREILEKGLYYTHDVRATSLGGQSAHPVPSLFLSAFLRSNFRSVDRKSRVFDDFLISVLQQQRRHE
ncbi:hypothetical protein TSAR_009372 [Trichomalopsis sarcophagae]|uniref:Uncharacterized protein n=1 Tax=Trichomalopsis sarcophagae TaxID=543379 RepID=A0A232FGX4_9HYME|nr:hypothetical protein TSAR_009372 [Trichomalopsis sarcophagae]